MTSEPAPAAGDPHDLLSTSRALTSRVRRDQRGAWFPLLVFAAVTFAAIPFMRYGPHHISCQSAPGGQSCVATAPLGLGYWTAALLLGYAAVGWFYLRRSRDRGIGTTVAPYVWVGAVLAVLTLGWALWAATHPAFMAGLQPGAGAPRDILVRLANPTGAIGLSLLLLAWIERSWLLAAVTAGYLVLGIVLVASIRTTNPAVLPSIWAFLPRLLIDGGVLVLGAVLLALIQRMRRTT